MERRKSFVGLRKGNTYFRAERNGVDITGLKYVGTHGRNKKAITYCSTGIDRYTL